MKRSLLALFIATLLGCSGQPAIEPAPADKSTEQLVQSIKSDLGGIAATGEGGSGLDSIRFAFEALKEKDAAKAGAVEKDVQALLKTAKPEERKTLATKISSQL